MIQCVYANQATAVATYTNGSAPATVTGVSNIVNVYGVNGPNWQYCYPSACCCCCNSSCATDCCSTIIQAVPATAIQTTRNNCCCCQNCNTTNSCTPNHCLHTCQRVCGNQSHQTSCNCRSSCHCLQCNNSSINNIATNTSSSSGQTLYDSPYAGFAAIGNGFNFSMAERMPYLRKRKYRSCCFELI